MRKAAQKSLLLRQFLLDHLLANVTAIVDAAATAAPLAALGLHLHADWRRKQKESKEK